MGAITERANLGDESEGLENFKGNIMGINDYEHTIGLKIQEREIDARNIMFLKKETKLSISDLKEHIASGDYILKYRLGDTKGLRHINVLKKELKGFNIAHSFNFLLSFTISFYHLKRNVK